MIWLVSGHNPNNDRIESMTALIERTHSTVTSDLPQRSRRLLLVAYNFPPVGGAGVQRPVKWVKHLRRFGWDVTVLTTENPSVPVRDESLLADIPDDVLVVRARTWEPDYQTKQGLVASATSASQGYLSRFKSAVKGLAKQTIKLALQPDPQVLWVPNAITAGRRVLSELSHDAILVTAPAYSSFFIGTALKRQFQIPLMLDFRDEWDLSGQYLENAQRDPMSQWIQQCMQSYVLRRADAVGATTQASTANLSEKLTRLNRSSTKAVTIYNGFDTEEFLADNTKPEDTPAAQKDPSTFRLLYTGTLWNLTSIEPLVNAILQLNQSAADLVAKLEVVCVGRKTPEQTSILERVRSTGCRLKLIDYCDHSRVLDWLRSANAVCLLLSDVAGAGRVVPAKLFEYLANRKEMLAIVPAGETAQIVNRFFPNGSLSPSEIDGIANWLKVRLSGTEQSSCPQPTAAEIDEFSRSNQTRQLVNVLNELVQDRSARRSNR